MLNNLSYHIEENNNDIIKKYKSKNCRLVDHIKN